MIKINKIAFAFSCLLVILGICKYMLIRMIRLFFPVILQFVSSVLRREVVIEQYVINTTPLEWLSLGIIALGLILSALFYVLEK